MSPITGILLAAGAGRRFGGHKLLQPLASGEPIAVAAGRNLIAAAPGSIAVVRSGDLRLAAALEAIGLRIQEHPGADGGLGTSLAAGVAATAEAAGWLIALGDMPWVRPETIRALADALGKGADLVAPVHAGTRGHPVGFAAPWRERLLALAGDLGARDLIAAHGARLVPLPTTDPGVLLDLDTQEDLSRLSSDPGGPEWPMAVSTPRCWGRSSYPFSPPPPLGGGTGARVCPANGLAPLTPALPPLGERG